MEVAPGRRPGPPPAGSTSSCDRHGAQRGERVDDRLGDAVHARPARRRRSASSCGGLAAHLRGRSPRSGAPRAWPRAWRGPPRRPDGLTGRLELAAQAALVHARAGQLAELAVGLFDGGGGGRALLEHPLQVLLRGALLGAALVEVRPERLRRRRGAPARSASSSVAQAAPSTRVRCQPVRCSSWWRAVSQSCIDAGGDGVEAASAAARAHRPAQLAKPSAAMPEVLGADAAARAARRRRRAEVAGEHLGQPSAVRRVGKGDGESPVQGAGSSVVVRAGSSRRRSRRIDPRHPSRRG